MLPLECVKDCEVKQSTEMSLGHFTIQRRNHPEMLAKLF